MLAALIDCDAVRLGGSGARLRPNIGAGLYEYATVDWQRLAAPSVWRRLTFEHGLFGQFVVMNREIVEQDGRMAARHFYCQFAHLGRADAPMFQIAYDGPGHCDYSSSLSVMYLNTALFRCGTVQNRSLSQVDRLVLEKPMISKLDAQ